MSHQTCRSRHAVRRPPLGFSQVLILKVVKVLCFDTLLQVLILKVVSWGRIQTVEIATSEANAEALRTQGDCGFITQRALRAEHRDHGELLVGFPPGVKRGANGHRRR